jgi:hypothetical protein
VDRSRVHARGCLHAHRGRASAFRRACAVFGGLPPFRRRRPGTEEPAAFDALGRRSPCYLLSNGGSR